jgi:hypothetical protein
LKNRFDERFLFVRICKLFFAKQRIFSKNLANFIPIAVANPKIVPMKPKTAPVERTVRRTDVIIAFEIRNLSNVVSFGGDFCGRGFVSRDVGNRIFTESDGGGGSDAALLFGRYS